MSLKPYITHIAPFERTRVFLQWALQGVDPSTATPVFTVERSSNHGTDFEVLASGVTDPFYIDDFVNTPTLEINILAQNRSLVYRVGVDVTGPAEDIVFSMPVDLDGNTALDPLYKEVHSVGLLPDEKLQSDVSPHSYLYAQPSLNRRLQLLHRAKVRRTILALRYLTGTNVTILKRKHYGVRCEICWVENAGVPIVSRCGACYGTSWEGGFHTPIGTLGKVVATPITASVGAEGDVHIRQARIGLPPFPVVEDEDIIVEHSNNRRWYVRSVDPVVFRSRTMKQWAVCTEIGRTAVEHSVPASVDNRNILAFPIGGG